jgi:hypothetical protein
MYQPGDRVVYRAQKFSMHPTLQAEAVEPLSSGEGYSYLVVKYWVVAQVLADDQLAVITRRGKQRIIAASDPRLRPATWWERWTKAGRFPQWPAAREPAGEAEADPSQGRLSVHRDAG